MGEFADKIADKITGISGIDSTTVTDEDGLVTESSTVSSTSPSGVTTTTSSWHVSYTDSEGNSLIKSHYVWILLVILVAGLLFHFRHRIAEAHDRYRTRRRNGNGYRGSAGFESDLERGLNSDTFSIQSNIDRSDSRKGLSEEATREITKIMNSEGVSFDEARLRYTHSQLDSNGIHSDGLPRDPKLVTFRD